MDGVPVKWVLAAAAAVLLVSGCGSSGKAPAPDQDACRAAMVEEFRLALATGEEGTEPPSCVGLDKATLTKLAGEAMDKAMEGDLDG